MHANSGGGGGITHIGTVYIAATGVKMWSNSEGVIKRSSGVFQCLYYS